MHTLHVFELKLPDITPTAERVQVLLELQAVVDVANILQAFSIISKYEHAAMMETQRQIIHIYKKQHRAKDASLRHLRYNRKYGRLAAI